MNHQRLRLATAISLSCISLSAWAAEVTFYITEEGSAAEGVSVNLDGQRKLVSPQGFVSFEMPAGSYLAEFSQYGAYIGEAEFELDTPEDTADLYVEVLGGEAIAETADDSMATGQISGQLISVETGGVISGARVSATGTDVGVMTDDNGAFILDLPRGDYELTVAHPSYNRKTVQANSMPGVPVNLSIQMGMSGNGVIEEVVAIGSYVPDTATTSERDASAVLDSIGAEQMSRFGDSSAASALKRVAGVSVVGGQYAVVRGMAGRYISSTLNGSLMPSTDPMKRDVPLDLFPASVLGGIDIQKAFTPDLPGDSTGGAIKMMTKGLPTDGSGSKLSATLGFNTRTTFSDIGGYDGGAYDFLGIDDGTRELPSYADSLTNGGRDSVNYCNNASLCLTPEQGVELSKSFTNTYSVKDITAQPERGFSLSSGEMYSDGQGSYFALQYKDKWSARHDGQISDGGKSGSFERSKRNTDLTGYYVFGKETDDWSVLSKSILLRKTDNTVKTSEVFDESKDQDNESVLLQWVERQYLGQQFSGGFYFNSTSLTQSLNWRVGFAQTSRYEPDRRQYNYINGNILPGSLERRFSDLTETVVDFGLDYEAEYMFSSDVYARFKSGLIFNDKQRDVNMGRFGVLTLDSSRASQTGVLEDILSDQAFEDYAYAVTTLTTSTDNYSATDSLLGGYFTTELEYHAVTALAGFRLEEAEQTLTYPDAPEADNELSSSKLLPALGLTWRVTEDFQLRGSLTQTISRPGLTERAESAQYDPDTDDLLRGNPNLEISDITNVDVRGEYYFSDDESISLALFNKYVDSPIERTVIEGDGSAVDGFTYQNEESATLNGIEVDFRKNIYDGESFSTTLGGNFSVIDSEVVLSEKSAQLEGTDTRQLQGQSKFLGNIQIELDHFSTGQSFTLLVNSFDDRIYAVSRGALANEVEDGRMTIDLVYRYAASDNLTVKGKVKNITDAKVSYSRDGSEIESYFEGTDVSVSIEYLF